MRLFAIILVTLTNTLPKERYQNNFYVILALIRFFCFIIRKYFWNYITLYIELLTIFKGLNEASCSQILRLEKTNNTFA